MDSSEDENSPPPPPPLRSLPPVPSPAPPAPSHIPHSSSSPSSSSSFSPSSSFIDPCSSLDSSAAPPPRPIPPPPRSSSSSSATSPSSLPPPHQANNNNSISENGSATNFNNNNNNGFDINNTSSYSSSMMRSASIGELDSKNLSPKMRAAPPRVPKQQLLKLKGYLKKETNRFKGWKKRWFYVQGNRLIYSETESSIKTLGFFEKHDIMAVEDVSATEDFRKNHGFPFVLRTKGRVMQVTAETIEEKNAWIDGLSEWISQTLSPSARESRDEENTKKFSRSVGGEEWTSDDEGEGDGDGDGEGGGEEGARGYLLKKDKKGNFQKMWFFVADNRFWYSRTILDENPVGYIPLSHASIVPSEFDAALEGHLKNYIGCGVCIKTRHRTYHLLATDAREQARWRSALSLYSEAAKGGRGGGGEGEEEDDATPSESSEGETGKKDPRMILRNKISGKSGTVCGLAGGWIVENRLLQMGTPSRSIQQAWRNPEAEVLAYLWRKGVRHILKLNQQARYDVMLFERKGVVVNTISWKDHTPPSIEQAILSVTLLSQIFRHNASAAIHCTAGIGRSGLISVAFLCIFFGTPLDEAIVTVRARRKGSVQRQCQVDFLVSLLKFMENNPSVRFAIDQATLLPLTNIEGKSSVQPECHLTFDEVATSSTPSIASQINLNKARFPQHYASDNPNGNEMSEKDLSSLLSSPSLSSSTRDVFVVPGFGSPLPPLAAASHSGVPNIVQALCHAARSSPPSPLFFEASGDASQNRKAMELLNPHDLSHEEKIRARGKLGHCYIFLLKQFFFALPEPLITPPVLEKMTRMVDVTASEVARVFSELPKANFDTLFYVLDTLSAVSLESGLLHSTQTANVALYFAPAFAQLRHTPPSQTHSEFTRNVVATTCCFEAILNALKQAKTFI